MVNDCSLTDSTRKKLEKGSMGQRQWVGKCHQQYRTFVSIRNEDPAVSWQQGLKLQAQLTLTPRSPNFPFTLLFKKLTKKLQKPPRRPGPPSCSYEAYDSHSKGQFDGADRELIVKRWVDKCGAMGIAILSNFEAMPRRKPEAHQDSSEEAEEVREEVEELDNAPLDASDESGEDLEDDPERDYQPIPELDHYEEEGIDDKPAPRDDPKARRQAERELEKRDQSRMMAEVEDYLDDELSEEMREQESRRKAIYFEEEDELVDQRRFLDAQEVKGKLPVWIREEETLKYIKFKFTKFLTHFKGEQDFPIYGTKIRQMCIANQQSIEISYSHLKEALPTIAMWVGLEPALILPQLNSLAYSIACKHYSSYKNIFPEVFIKIRDLPIIDYIRDLRHVHLGKLIRIQGVVTIRSEVFSQLKKIIYKCIKCGFLKGPFYINTINDVRLGACSSCQSTGPFPIDKQKTLYRNYQKLTLQEAPSEVLPGRIPRSKEVVLFGDNIDVARPGDHIQVTGIYMNRYECALNIRQGFPLFVTLIEANSVVKLMQGDRCDLDSAMEDKIIKFSKTESLDQLIYQSIAPSIYGHYNVKRALTLAMFGGVERVVEGTHRIRGDINVLLLGDPGIAKSQFLKSIQKVFYRSIYTTGKGASAVGLTASVKRDHATNEWKLQAGALVLADKGLCLIDEFDKMNQHDRTSIHEAMEQQSISISKAGIVTTLRARCSVIAAANPLQGRYNAQLSFSENVDLSEPILSRFDILNVIRDEANEEIDYNLSTFVINLHIKSHPYKEQYALADQLIPEAADTRPKVDPEFLREYIRYAREKCRPELSEKYLGMVNQFYVKLREESKISGGMNVAVRHIESILRVSVAHAKMHLRSQVGKEDIEVGIRCILESFIQTQKHSVAKQIRKKFSTYLQ